MCGFLSRLFRVGRTNITGRWVEAATSSTDVIRGFVLFNDGRAMSVNHFAPKYEKWVRSGDMLILMGRAMCGQNCLEFTETMRIQKLTRSDMILNHNEHVRRYMRYLD